eukprot:12757398-Alexandrium_andersonii.AAC.1
MDLSPPWSKVRDPPPGFGTRIAALCATTHRGWRLLESSPGRRFRALGLWRCWRLCIWPGP